MKPEYLEPLKEFLNEKDAVFSDELFDEFFNWSYRLDNAFSLETAINKIINE